MLGYMLILCFHRTYTILHIHCSALQFQFSTPLPILVIFSLFVWIMVNIMDMNRYLTVVLTCIFLMANDIELLLMCLVTVCVIFGDASIQVFAFFLIRVFDWHYWVLGVFFNMFWILVPYQMSVLKIFSPILLVVFCFTDTKLIF